MQILQAVILAQTFSETFEDQLTLIYILFVPMQGRRPDQLFGQVLL